MLLAAPLAAQDATFTPHVEEASGEGRAALATIDIADGIACDLWAEEPMLANPVCLYVDHGGDVYVAETFRHFAGVTDMRDHMDWLDEDIAARTVQDRLDMMARHEGDQYDAKYAVATERIRLIRDTDGDGRADTAVVFADDFDEHADGIGAGLLSYRGDVYYTCIPDLWLLRDTDADGVADEREVLSTGYGVHIALLGHDLHGLRIGPDRRLYFSCGDRAFRVETENGVLDHPESGAVLRCDLDGSNLEVWHSGLRNPQELVFNEYGELFTGDNNSDGGDRARWVNIVDGADSGWRYAYQWITSPVMRGPWNDEKLWHPAWPGQAAYVLPPIANLADGPSGLTYYPGVGLSEDYAGHFFLCDFRGDPAYSGVHTFTVEPQGASYTLGKVERFLWNTLVTDADFGPDGRLYFSDWVNGWNKTGKGRVFRAFDPEHVDSELTRSTAKLLAGDFSKLAFDELAALLRHPDMRVRQEAHFALADTGRVADVAKLAQPSKGGTKADRLANIHAIWALGILARTQPDAAERALLPLAMSSVPEVADQATRVIGDERLNSCTEVVIARMTGQAPRSTYLAALAASRLGNPDAIAPAVRILEETGEDDRNLRHAATMVLLRCADEEALAALYDHPSKHVRTAALVVLRRRAHADVARFLTDAEPSVVLEAARAINDAPVDAAVPALAGLRIPSDAPAASAALARRVLNARLRLGDAAGLASAAERDELAPAIRAEALAMLADWSTPSPRDLVCNAPRPYPKRDAKELASIADRLATSSVPNAADEVFARFADLVVASGAKHDALFRDVCMSPDRSAAARIAALHALEATGSSLFAETVRAALGDVDGEVRAAALDGLERLAPGEALPSLEPILAKGETSERRVALRILGRAKDPSATTMLDAELAKAEQGLFPDELRLDLRRAALEHGVDAITARFTALRANATDEVLAPWLDALYGGDADRGRQVFQRVDLSCVRCHATKDTDSEGRTPVGPDLTGVTKRLARLQVLESILAPNRRTTPGYAGSVLFLTDGSIVNGRILEDTDERIVVLNSDGEEIEVHPDDVDERAADLSAMPEDLAKTITPEEMRDLLAYLGSL